MQLHQLQVSPFWGNVIRHHDILSLSQDLVPSVSFLRNACALATFGSTGTQAAPRRHLITNTAHATLLLQLDDTAKRAFSAVFVWAMKAQRMLYKSHASRRSAHSNVAKISNDGSFADKLDAATAVVTDFIDAH